MDESTDNKILLSKIVASDLPRGTALLGDLTGILNSVLAGATAFRDKVKNGEMDTSKGISLLELKNQTFLSYLTNLSFVILRKLSGAKLEDDKSIEHLVELRAVMERLRPLEDKLKYRIDKYVKVANEGSLSVSDPLRTQGNLDNIGSSSDDDEEDKVKENAKTVQDPQKGERVKKKELSKTYKVPKVAPVHYDEDSKKEALEKARRRALNSAVLRDALFEHVDEPEVVYNADTLKHKSVKKRKELERYEEDNFVRKTLSKKEEAELNQFTTIGTMRNELLGLGNVDALQDDYVPGGPPAKKRKTGKALKGKKGKGKKGKKGFKKRNR
ncbi:neuroguidin-like [Macrobrachium nipponense]|uniref:neuroguidin-like n=1 Tax=Macrobrachium nipponense TaxID=159736 RepID=UPI0030C7BA69